MFVRGSISNENSDIYSTFTSHIRLVKQKKICDPPYENMSYSQKRFLGGLRSPVKPGFRGFETLFKLFGNPFETLWKPF